MAFRWPWSSPSQPPEVERAPVYGVEMGSSGLRTQGRRITEEWMRNLRGAQGRVALQEMRDQSAVVGAITTYLLSIVSDVDYYVEPAPPDVRGSDEAAAFLQSRVDGLTHRLESVFVEGTDGACTHGFSPQEIVYRRGDDGRPAWERFASRSPTTIEEWEFDPRGRWTHMIQKTPSGRQVFIPRELVVNFRNQPRLDNPEGRSFWRNGYSAYYYAKTLATIEAITAERDATGLLVFRVPPPVMASTTSAEHAATRTSLEEQGQQFRSDERLFLMLPAKEWAGKATGYDVENLRGAGARLVDTDKVIRRWEARLAMVGAGEMMMLGIDGSTSNAADVSKGQRFEKVVNGILDAHVSTFNDDAVRRLYDLDGRFLAESRAHIRHSEVRAPDVQGLFQSISDLLRGGGLTPDDALENHLRTLAGLPPLDPDALPVDDDEE